MTETVKLNVNTSADAILKQREMIQSDKNKQEKSKKVEFDEKNYLTLRLNKGEAKRTVTVRVLPVSSEDPNVFLMLKTHSSKVPTEVSKSGYKSYICFNEEKIGNNEERLCPLCRKSKELLEQCNSLPNDAEHAAEKKALFKEAMQYKLKNTYIVRVIERGHEEDGVKFWRFNAHDDGTGIYDQLMSIFDNRAKESIDTGDAYYKVVTNNTTGEEEYVKVDEDEYNSLPDNERRIIPYNIFDLNNGKDFIITLQYVESTGRTTLNISDAGKETPLSKDYNKAMSWVNDQKTWLDLYSLKTYEYLELISEKKIPFYDKANKKWVDKDTVSKEDVAVVEARKILSGESQGNSEITRVTDNNEDDLPF